MASAPNSKPSFNPVKAGPPGPRGLKGDKGDKGIPGISIKGPKGDRGLRGEKGEKGDSATAAAGAVLSVSFIAPLVNVGSATDPVGTLAPNGVTATYFRKSAAFTLVGNSTNAPADVQDIVLGSGLSFIGNALTVIGSPPSGAAGGDLTGSYPNPTIATHVVSNAKFRQSAAYSVVGNPTGGLADVQDISASADNQFLGRIGGALVWGAVPASAITTWPTGVLSGSLGALIGTSIATNSIPSGNSLGGLSSNAGLLYASNALTISTSDGSGNAIVLNQNARQVIVKTGTGNFEVGTTGSGSLILNTGTFPRLTFDNTGTMRLNSLPGPGHLKVDASGFVSVDATTFISTATPPLFITGADIEIHGAVVTGSTSTSPTNLGSLASGVLQQSVTAGVSTPSVFAAGSTRIPFGSGTAGGFTDDAGFAYVGGSIALSTTGLQQLNKQNGALSIGTLDNNAVFLFTNGTTKVVLNASGTVRVLSLASSLVKTDSSGTLLNATAGTDYADPLSTYWVSSSSHLPTNGVNLGALSSGLLYQSVTTGVSTPAALNLTAGAVVFGGSGGAPAQDASNLFWDNTNKFLGIGVASPSLSLDILHTVAGVAGFRVTNASNSSSAQVQNVLVNDIGSFAYYGVASSTFSGFAPINAGKAFFGGFQNDVSIFTQSAKDIIFYTNATEVGRWKSGGGLQVTNIAAPSTPASGTADIYVDSTSLNISSKDSAGNVNHGIRSNTGTAHQWVSAIADNGTVTLTQPSYSDISGSVPAITQLTGDVAAGPGSGSQVATIQPHVVSYAKMQQVAANRLLGNSSGSTTDVTEIPLNAPLFFSGSNVILNYDGTSLVLSGGTTLVRAALTGDVAASIASNSTTIQPHVVSYAKMQQASTVTLLGNPSGGLADISEITLGTGLTFTGTTLVNTSPLSSLAVTPPIALSGTTLSLNIDSTLAVVSSNLGRAAISGDVAISAGSNTSVIGSHTVSYAKMQQASASTLLGNPTGSLADLSEITLGTNLSFSGSVLNATGGSDHKISIDGADTTYDFLAAKLTATLPITLTVAGGTPAPPTTNMVAWWKSDAGVSFSSGTIVSNIVDQSGNGNNVSVLGGDIGPQLDTGIVNGLPAFNCFYSTIVTMVGTGTLLTTGSPYYIVTIVRMSPVAAGFSPAGFGMGGGFTDIGSNVQSVFGDFGGDIYVSPSVNSPNTGIIANDTPYVYEFGSDTVTQTAFVNGTGLTLSNTTPMSPAGTDWYLFADPLGGNGPFWGWVVETIVYSDVPSPTDLAQLRGYMQFRSGVTVAGAGGGGGGGAETLNVAALYDNASITLNGSNQLRRAAITGDVAISAGSNTSVLGNIPNDTTMAGDLLVTEISAPSTPASGHLRIWGDSTQKNLQVVNEGAITSHTVQTRSVVSHQFLTGNTVGGAWNAAQPDFTDLTGTASAAQLGSFTNGSVLFWNSGLAQDNANFSYDGTAHTLSLSGSTPLSLPLAGTQNLSKSNGDLGFLVVGAHAMNFATNSAVRLTIDSTGGVGVNGASIPSNASLSVGIGTNTDRDRLYFVVGGGTLGATGTQDSTLFTINPQATNVVAGVTAGIYSTLRVRSTTYTGISSPTITEAASFYINGPPVLSSVTGNTYSVHVASGDVRIDQIAGPGFVTVDGLGVLGSTNLNTHEPVTISLSTGLATVATSTSPGLSGGSWMGQGFISPNTGPALEWGHSAVGGTIVGITINMLTNTYNDTVHYTVTKNGVATAVTVSFTAGTTGFAGTTGSVSWSVTDLFGIKMTSSNTLISTSGPINVTGTIRLGN